MTQTIRMGGTNGNGLLLQKYEDVIFTGPGNPELGVKYVKDFQYRAGDVVLCSYPKSGTHWMGNMIWKLKSIDSTDVPPETVLEIGPPELFENQPEPRLISTHFKPNRLYPSHIENKGKVILMLRNPKDVAVSFYYHLKNGIYFKNNQTWDEYFQSFISGEIFSGSYFTYIQQWEQQLRDIETGDSNLQIEVFYYEDFQQNPFENISRLNKYLHLNRDDAYLTEVLHETTLGALKMQYNDKSENRVHKYNNDAKGDSIIFRKGKVGDWKDHLTVAQSETIDTLLHESLQHGIIKFKYEI